MFCDQVYVSLQDNHSHHVTPVKSHCHKTSTSVLLSCSLNAALLRALKCQHAKGGAGSVDRGCHENDCEPQSPTLQVSLCLLCCALLAGCNSAQDPSMVLNQRNRLLFGNLRIVSLLIVHFEAMAFSSTS